MQFSVILTLTKTHALDGLHVALACDLLSQQVWMVVSDQPTTVQTFHNYGELSNDNEIGG